MSPQAREAVGLFYAKYAPMLPDIQRIPLCEDLIDLISKCIKGSVSEFVDKLKAEDF